MPFSLAALNCSLNFGLPFLAKELTWLRTSTHALLLGAGKPFSGFSPFFLRRDLLLRRGLSFCKLGWHLLGGEKLVFHSSHCWLYHLVFLVFLPLPPPLVLPQPFSGSSSCGLAFSGCLATFFGLALAFAGFFFGGMARTRAVNLNLFRNCSIWFLKFFSYIYVNRHDTTSKVACKYNHPNSKACMLWGFFLNS